MTGSEHGRADPEIWGYTTELVEELAAEGVEADFNAVLTGGGDGVAVRRGQPAPVQR